MAASENLGGVYGCIEITQPTVQFKSPDFEVGHRSPRRRRVSGNSPNAIVQWLLLAIHTTGVSRLRVSRLPIRLEPRAPDEWSMCRGVRTRIPSTRVPRGACRDCGSQRRKSKG